LAETISRPLHSSVLKSFPKDGGNVPDSPVLRGRGDRGYPASARPQVSVWRSVCVL
jgi:hypothetical protein